MERYEMIARRMGLKMDQLTVENQLKVMQIDALETVASNVSDLEDKLADIRNEIRELREDDGVKNALHEITEKLEKIYMEIPSS